jgi:hypothetical protein
MPKTNAERQRAWRQRCAGHIAALEAEAAELRIDLDTALAEVERLSASQCRHPAAAVDGSHCRVCNTEIW